MALPDIDFKAIRLHRGVQSDAFEEMCCQLASDEAKTLGARFVRKGRGADGGVEAFAILPTGHEIGWQVKYYWDIDAALKSLSDSLATALAKHPAMDRFIACIPFDPADGRRANSTSALQKWEAWRKAEITRAAPRAVEIELWPAQGLRDRLVASTKAAGRIAFWFDKTLLTQAWFEEKHVRAMKSLGARYTPLTNVKLPIRHAILALTRDRAFLEELRHLTAEISQALSRAPDTAGETAEKARGAVSAAIVAMQAVVDDEPDDLPQKELAARLVEAEIATVEWRWADYREAKRSQSSADISRLLGRVTDARERLISRRWSLINARRLLVTGEGGRGKSHLLADACQHQIDAGAPALFILSHLLGDSDPWPQIVTALDLPRHLRVEEFLGALNAAAQAVGVRASVVIDGINERGGQTLWSARLAGFLHDVEPYSWISVVLSCRTTYLSSTIPAELDEAALPRLEHTGFSTSDAARYLDMRRVTTLDAPWPMAEFDTPLFLKTLCDGLALSGGTTLPKGSQGISTIFDLYAKAVAAAVQRDMELTPKLAHVPRLVAALAEEIDRTGDPAIPYARADEIAISILPHDGHSKRDLLFQLIASGLLATDPDDDDDSEVVRFTFERFGDFAVAEGLVRDCVTAEDLKARLVEDSPLTRVLSGATNHHGGILEALAVMAPERFSIELLDLPIPPEMSWEATQAFIESLMTREATAFTDHTWDLVRQYGGADGEWDARIRLASEPKAAQNAEALHTRLKAMPMPERDAAWSVHLAQSSRAASQLIDWALKPRGGVLAGPRALLVAITLTWFLSTSHRGLRDRATKALVAVLTDQPGLVPPLLERFIDVDDGYVTERLLCVIYGAALQGRWAPDSAAQAVQAVDRELFIKRPAPVNCLTREHGRLLIRWAIVHGVVPADYDAAPSSGPFSSPWPIEHVPDMVIDGFTQTYASGYVGRDAIVASCVEDGDFARYVLDRAVDAWSPARRGTSSLPTQKALHDAWKRDFDAEATPESQAAYLCLTQALAADHEEAPWREGPRATAAKAAFAVAAGADMFERWREEAENWRRSGMFQRPQPRDYAEFNLAWARRWVCLRAHQLGWLQTLHGAFDDTIHNGRMSHHVERIGKKYQWLALYELRARMADNLEPTGREANVGPEELRAIDPSLLAGARFGEEDDVASDAENDTIPLKVPEWTRSVVLPPVTLNEALLWRDDLEDLPDGLNGIEIMIEGRPWLVLKSFDSWRGGPESLNRQLSRWLTCFVVSRRDLPAFLKLVEGDVELDHDRMLEGEERVPWRSYLGEHPWLWIKEPDSGWNRPWRPRKRPRGKGVQIRGTTIGYLAEERGYDQSLAVTVEARLLRPWLMRALDLRLGDGRAIEYVDRDGRTLFRDPTAEGAATTMALIDRTAFLGLLTREDLAAVWLIAGEKNVYGSGSGKDFGGRRYYARVAHSVGGPLTLGDQATRLAAPSAAQLEAIRGLSTG
ncbi:AAA family ATPase [Roseomonas gilardii]|uniref:AAA family ATPase n=1 Tax=Roseomonas gilardii TaxID=257708 RepID=A0ABU3MIS5_9PROT|nr:AAA family ATPase [Roseomonas gilardii]MDT8332904.1 AAA family ATPase [Roseomonas gilardii]